MGGLGNAIQGAFGDLRGLISEETTVAEFIEHLVTNLVAGGIIGWVQSAIPAARLPSRDRLGGTDGLTEAETSRVLDFLEKEWNRVLAEHGGPG